MNHTIKQRLDVTAAANSAAVSQRILRKLANQHGIYSKTCPLYYCEVRVRVRCEPHDQWPSNSKTQNFLILWIPIREEKEFLFHFILFFFFKKLIRGNPSNVSWNSNITRKNSGGGGCPSWRRHTPYHRNAKDIRHPHLEIHQMSKRKTNTSKKKRISRWNIWYPSNVSWNSNIIRRFLKKNHVVVVCPSWRRHTPYRRNAEDIRHPRSENSPEVQKKNINIPILPISSVTFAGKSYRPLLWLQYKTWPWPWWPLTLTLWPG